MMCHKGMVSMIDIPSKKATVLIVDDIAENVWFLAEALKDRYHILATSSSKALEVLQRPNVPDGILLAVELVEPDGYKLCGQIKLDPRLKDIPVLLMTVVTDPQEEAYGLQLGAAEYLHKPFSADILRVRVHNVLTANNRTKSLQKTAQDHIEQQNSIQEGAIWLLADVAEWQDPETRDHIKRTQKYMALLATELAKNPKYSHLNEPHVIEWLRLCAPLHDVGKISISDDILLKKGKLTPDEILLMQQHPVYGAELLTKTIEDMQSDGFWKFAHEIVRWHHERWDGRGYPDGLKQDEIPLAAQIMAVVDVYDAIVSLRPYKQPLPHEEAVEIIQESAGGHFAPDVVNALIETEARFADISKNARRRT